MPNYSIANLESFLLAIEDHFQAPSPLATLEKLSDLLVSPRLIEVREEEEEEGLSEVSRGFIDLKVRKDSGTEDFYLSGYYISYRWQTFDDVDFEKYSLTTRAERIVTSRSEFLLTDRGPIVVQRVRDFHPSEILDHMRHIVEDAVEMPLPSVVPIRSIDSRRLIRFSETELSQLRAIRFAGLRPANPEPPTEEELVEAVSRDSESSRVESVEYSTGRRHGDLRKSRIVKAFRTYVASGYGSLIWLRGLMEGLEETGPIEIGQSKGKDLKISINLPPVLQDAHSKILRVLRAIAEVDER